MICVITALNKSVPFYWGNEVMAKKMSYLLNQSPKNFNTFFIGSSHTYRHIDPIIFDSVTNCNSFNLGAPGMGHLEAIYILENFLGRYSSDKRINIFLQNSRLWQIKEKNLHSVRSKYYLDLKRTVWAVKYWLNKNPKNYKQVYNHLLSYVENLLCIGKVKEIITFHFFYENSINNKVIDQKGFYSLDQELQLENNKDLLVRTNRFKKNKDKKKPSKISKKIKVRKANVNSFKNLPVKENLNYFRLGKFNLTSAYFFDRGHFNMKGAKYYTQKIGESFLSFKEACK